MTTIDIISKLAKELDTGITSEVQVVYVLSGIRKLMERDKVEGQYADLKFHCDWVLHSSMDRAAAKAILRQFDAAQPLFRDGQELPPELKSEIDRISKMRSFEKELEGFLTAYNLPPLTKNRPDGWVHFLHLYTKVIEDIPLTVYSPAATQNISHVTVHSEQAQETLKHPQGEEVLFTVTWRIHDKNGQSGTYRIFNSFSL